MTFEQVLLPGQTRIVLRQNGGAPSSVLAAMAPRAGSRSILGAAYRQADAVIFQTRSTAEELEDEFHLDRVRLRVLPNPVDIRSIRQTCLSPNRQTTEPYLLACGRLVPEKGFDLLIDAFALLKPRFPALQLLIAGSAPGRTALQSQSRRLGIDDRNHVPRRVFSVAVLSRCAGIRPFFARG